MTEITDPPNVPDPTTGPDRVSAPADYDAKTTIFRVKQRAFAVSLPPIATWMRDLAVLIKGWATTASNAATSASAAQTAAENAASATAWVSGGSYTQGDVHWSLIDYLPYRAKTTHSGLTTDPSLDDTNWAVQAIKPDTSGLNLFSLWVGA